MNHELPPDRAALQQATRARLVFTPRPAAAAFDQAQRHLAALTVIRQRQALAEASAQAWRAALGVADTEEPAPPPTGKRKAKKS